MSESPVDRDLPETKPAEEPRPLTAASIGFVPVPVRAPRRHTAEVTADRLQADLVNFVDYLTPIERAAMNRAIVALDSIPDRIRLAGGEDE